MKICSKCKSNKEPQQFYKGKRKPDGLKSQCKVCHCGGNIRTRDKDEHKKYNREFMRRTRVIDPEKYRSRERLASRNRVKNNKTEARMKLNSALKSRKIIKPEYCQQCNEKKRLTGHHADYSKPLEVEWLCYECHASRHSKVLK